MQQFNIGTYTRSPNRYIYGGVRGRAWMFRVNANTGQLNYAEKYRSSHYVYQRADYMLTWGGGHDYQCRNDGYAYSNFDYDYDAPGGGYGSGHSKSWLTGSYSYNCKNDLIEIYHTEA